MRSSEALYLEILDDLFRLEWFYLGIILELTYLELLCALDLGFDGSHIQLYQTNRNVIQD